MNLAAVLIVRDSAAVLSRCLTSLCGVVDSIYVHDTGSTDSTPDLARQLGAVVTRGAWTGDFAAARNGALAAAAAARGVAWGPADWVLSVDDDDRVIAAPAKLREMLAATASDALVVDIDNLHDELPYTHRAARLFRPANLRWRGRLHEHLVSADGTEITGAVAGVGRGRGERYGTVHGTPTETGTAEWPAVPREVLRLEHAGYADPDERRRKAERNVELAQAVLDGLVAQGDAADPVAVADTLLDLGRSFVGAGRTQDAVNTFETLRELSPGTRQWVLGTDALARLLLGAGMDEAVLALTAQLRGAGVARDYCDWLDAQALAQLGEVAEAWRLLQPVHRVVDPAGRVYPPEHLAELKRLLDRLHALPSGG